jgi:hypothetical protein
MAGWYYLLVLRAVQFVRVASLAVAVIGVCTTANWLGNLGWGYKWPTAPLLIVITVAAFVVNQRMPKSLIRRLKHKVEGTANSSQATGG